MQALFNSNEATRERKKRAARIVNRLAIAEARAVRKDQLVDASAFVHVLGNIRSILDDKRLSEDELRERATSYIANWNQYIASTGGQALLLSHKKAYELREESLAIALHEDAMNEEDARPGQYLSEIEFEKVARDLVEDLAPDEEGSAEILERHASILKHHIEIFSGRQLILPNTHSELRALLLAMTPQGVLLATAFRLIESFSGQMMDKRGPTKSDHETLYTNANFIARFPETIIDRGESFTAAHIRVKFPHSLKVANAYSSLLAPGLQRRRDSIMHRALVDFDPRFEGKHPARRHSEAEDDGELRQKPLHQVQTWSLAARRRRESVSAFQPVSRHSFLP